MKIKLWYNTVNWSNMYQLNAFKIKSVKSRIDLTWNMLWHLMFVFITIITNHSAINVIISPVSHASCYQDTKHTESHSARRTAHHWEQKLDPSFRTKWKNSSRAKRESKEERFGNSRGSDGSFIRSQSPRAGWDECLVCPSPYQPGQARHPLGERALRPGGAFTPLTKPSGVISPFCLSIPPQ